VLDAGDRLVIANRAARLLFNVGRGDLGRPFQDLDISYKPVDLRGPVDQVRREQEAFEISVELNDSDGGTRNFEVRVEPLLENGSPVAVKIRFLDVSRYHELAGELSRSKRELEVAYEELQSTNEELETTNEELQSTNEELETTNEELQSTNEELETMNEELQSTNVEIEAVNQELQERTEELDRVNRYVSTILNSLRTAFVVMNRDYEVRVWNEGAARLWGLRSEDVEGKSFIGLEIGLPVGALKEALQRCLTGEDEQIEARVDGHDRRGKSVRHQVRCVPLRDGHGKEISGVIAMVEAQSPDGRG
jgi:two-component system CheB/CheR fusion protein